MPNDMIYSFRSDNSPSIYFDYFPEAANVATNITVCHQAYSSSTSTCATNSQRTPTATIAQDVPIDATGIYSSGSGVWDYYTMRVWGNLDDGTTHSVYKIIGGGISTALIAQLACW